MRSFLDAKIHNIQIYTLSLSSLRNLKNKSYDNDGIKFTEKYLYDLIKGMDEERLSKVETYIKRLCLAKQKESLYPWAPDEAELTCKIAESEVDFNNGDYCSKKR